MVTLANPLVGKAYPPNHQEESYQASLKGHREDIPIFSAQI
jgi:hypothetical protein